MVNKGAVFIFICIVLLCLFPSAAQEKTEQTANPGDNALTQEKKQSKNDKKNYFIKETDEGVTLIQRLSWESVDDIFGFEFELERQDKKTKKWQQIDKQELKTNYADVSLSPGSYRYRVWIINLLEQREEVSAYRNFDIRFAYQPEIASVSPQVINFDEMEDQILTITGTNLHEDTVFKLTDSLTGAVLQGSIAELNEDGKRVIVAFEFTKANPGRYTLTAIDPSDLSAEQPGIIFRYQKPIDIFLSGGYFFNGFIGNKVFKEYFNTDIAPAGGGIRLTVAPIKRYYGNFGFNFTGSGSYLKNKTDGYTVKAGLLFTQLNAAYFVPIIKHRLVFDVHAGFGAAFMLGTEFVYNTQTELKSPKAWYWGLTVNAGTALYVYVYKRLYVEINVDHLIPIRGNKGFPTYIIQPQLGIGWEF